MAKVVIWVNSPADHQVVTEDPYSTATTGGFQYSDDVSNNLYYGPALSRLQTAHPNKSFKAGNPNSPPPQWP